MLDFLERVFRREYEVVRAAVGGRGGALTSSRGRSTSSSPTGACRGAVGWSCSRLRRSASRRTMRVLLTGYADSLVDEKVAQWRLVRRLGVEADRFGRAQDVDRAGHREALSSGIPSRSDVDDFGEAEAALGVGDVGRRGRQPIEIAAHVGHAGSDGKIGEARLVVGRVADEEPVARGGVEVFAPPARERRARTSRPCRGRRRRRARAPTR